MRRFAILLLLTMALPTGVALAHDHGHHGTCVSDVTADPPLEWGHRHDPGRSRYAMVSREGSAVFLITRGEVAVQLSDRVMRKIEREMQEDEDDDGALGTVIKDVVLGGVKALLNHSLECPLDELRDVRYRDGRLELISLDGERLFEDVQINDRDLLESFRPQDARAFVEEFHRLVRVR